MIRLFISYSNKDSLFANRLAIDLSNLGANVFYSKFKIKVGDSIVEKIDNALSSYDNLLVILSNSSIKSNWVKRELNSSLMRQLNNQSIKIRPILIENCNVPTLLADIKYADFRENYRIGFNDLVDSLKEEFELESYVEIVESSCPQIEKIDLQKELAIVLKIIDPIPFFRNEILSFINDSKEIPERSLLDRFNSNNVVYNHLEYLEKNELIERLYKNNERHVFMKPLGKNICVCLNFAFNEGLLSPTCSS